MGSKRACEVCRQRPATMPDRNRMGRLTPRICVECHLERLRGDMRRIVEVRTKRKEAPDER